MLHQNALGGGGSTLNMKVNLPFCTAGKQVCSTNSQGKCSCGISCCLSTFIVSHSKRNQLPVNSAEVPTPRINKKQTYRTKFLISIKNFYFPPNVWLMEGKKKNLYYKNFPYYICEYSFYCLCQMPFKFFQRLGLGSLVTVFLKQV